MKKITILLLILFLLSDSYREHSVDLFREITGISLLKKHHISRSDPYDIFHSLFFGLRSGTAIRRFFLEADLKRETLKQIENISPEGYSELKEGAVKEAFLLWVDFGYENTGFGKGRVFGDKVLQDLFESGEIKYRVKLLNEHGNRGELIIYDYRYNKLWFTKWNF